MMFKKKERYITVQECPTVGDFLWWVRTHKIKQKDIQQIIKEGEKIILFYWVEK